MPPLRLYSFTMIPSRIGWILPLGAALVWTAAAGERVDFNFEVRPLLSDRCFFCHGPDDKARKAKLRLDQREGLFQPRKDGTWIIKPGDPAGSELLKRVLTTDPDDIMPPPDSHLELSPAEKGVLRRWIEQGAEWGDHWAFRPLNRSTPPKAPEGVRVVNPIDQFVTDRLAASGLEPSPPADPARLLRRIRLDLTGLPPTPEELEAFVRDPSPAAYEQAVDRLLASPAYGERQANEWLDLARFADTYGYQTDADRDLSPWRDWVIKAFNENLSYDQFITWQLAGDLLPAATDEQILATAFNRLHRQTNEGGSIEEEFRHEYVADRVHTMGTAFLGLTLECSRCHDHKYDPISQRDYYSLAAFFNNIDESGLYSHFTAATPTPTLLRWEGDTKARHAELKRQLAQAEERLAIIAQEARARFAATSSQPPLPAPVAHYTLDAIVDNRTPDRMSTNAASLSEGPEISPGKRGQSFRFSGDNSVTVPVAGQFKRTQPFSFDLWLRPTEQRDRAVILHYSQAWTDSGSRGYELVLDHGRPFFALIHFWPGNALAVRAKDPLPLNDWSEITVTYDGSSRASGVRLYRNGLPLETEVVRDRLTRDIQHRGAWGDSGEGSIRLSLAARFRDRGFRNGEIDELQVFNTCLTPGEVKTLAGYSAGEDLEDAFQAYLARKDVAYQEAFAAVQKLRDAENDLVGTAREIMVMTEMPVRRPTFVLKRGAYDSPADPVEPNAPERILPFPSDLPRNRLGFARWVTDPRNPLTSRVAVNRVWKQHFGRGLVGTLNDFGAQGQLPDNPQLLDWLAGEFIRSGWDLKALHKRIVMSATYQQSSEGTPESVAKDPENRLLSRGPKHRLGAEQIRDQALAVSGLLSPEIGGRSVKPYQPPGVWEEAGTGKSYSQDHGDKLYRRSLYTFWRRTAPPPSMLSFDAVTREVCTANREVTSTPLQSLVLLNDTQFLEAARVLAESLWRDPVADGRIERAFQRVLGRVPKPSETRILRQLFEEQRAYFSQKPEEAAQLLKTGEKPVDPSLPPVDLAAATLMVSTLMNHDEFVMKR